MPDFAGAGEHVVRGRRIPLSLVSLLRREFLLEVAEAPTRRLHRGGDMDARLIVAGVGTYVEAEFSFSR